MNIHARRYNKAINEMLKYLEVLKSNYNIVLGFKMYSILYCNANLFEK